jgi:hypothetical protein
MTTLTATVNLVLTPDFVAQFVPVGIATQLAIGVPESARQGFGLPLRER